MTDQEFTEISIVKLMSGKGGWHYVLLPYIYIELSYERSGKKVSPITARIGNTEWLTSIFPTKDKKGFIAIKADVRNAENIKEDDKIKISFRFRK